MKKIQLFIFGAVIFSRLAIGGACWAAATGPGGMFEGFDSGNKVTISNIPHIPKKVLEMFNSGGAMSGFSEASKMRILRAPLEDSPEVNGLLDTFNRGGPNETLSEETKVRILENFPYGNLEAFLPDGTLVGNESAINTYYDKLDEERRLYDERIDLERAQYAREQAALQRDREGKLHVWLQLQDLYGGDIGVPEEHYVDPSTKLSDLFSGIESQKGISIVQKLYQTKRGAQNRIDFLGSSTVKSFMETNEVDKFIVRLPTR